MSLYGRFFAAMYDRMLAGTEEAGLSAARDELLAQARGQVLEIGAGTGLNLDHYGAGVERLVLTEPEAPMVTRLRRHVSETGAAAEVVQAPAESLPFEDDSFDTVVSTLALCTVSDPDRALAEIARVLRPGGQLLFFEHVRSEDPGLARWQDRIAPVWRRIGHGCNCNRATAGLIGAAGLEVTELSAGQLPKSPPIVRPTISGRATAH